MSEFRLQVFRARVWADLRSYDNVGEAAESMASYDRDSHLPRRIINDRDGVVMSGRHCVRDAPTTDIQPTWIVMSLDKPGPRERDNAPYFRHPTKEIALAEARRLSAACHGRFAVMQMVHVVGWIDHAIDHDDGIPF
jgi:hypothetical protein